MKIYKLLNDTCRDWKQKTLNKASKDTNTFVHTFLILGLLQKEELPEVVGHELHETMYLNNDSEAIHTLEEDENSMIFTSKYKNIEIISNLDFKNNVFELETNWEANNIKNINKIFGWLFLILGVSNIGIGIYEQSWSIFALGIANLNITILYWTTNRLIKIISLTEVK